MHVAWENGKAMTCLPTRLVEKLYFNYNPTTVPIVHSTMEIEGFDLDSEEAVLALQGLVLFQQIEELLTYINITYYLCIANKCWSGALACTKFEHVLKKIRKMSLGELCYTYSNLTETPGRASEIKGIARARNIIAHYGLLSGGAGTVGEQIFRQYLSNDRGSLAIDELNVLICTLRRLRQELRQENDFIGGKLSEISGDLLRGQPSTVYLDDS